MQGLSEYESTRLFVERAAAVKSDFARTEQSALAIAQICRRLDGIPLAIELAAVRVKSLSVEQIAARLDDRFHLLTSGSRTALPRQQTLRALIDWSYDLISESERVFFQRLSVFTGGASWEAIEAICACQPPESYDGFEALADLADKSLVIVEEKYGASRYRMLETIRQYAYDKLQPAEERARVRACHCDYFLRLVEEGEPYLAGAQQLTWLNRLETEYDNILAALEWAQAADVEACLRFGGALWRFWNMRGYWTEGRERLAKILALDGAASPTRARARALTGAAYLAMLQSDYAAARALFDESLVISRALGGQKEIASAVSGLGSIAASQGDYALARAKLTEGLTLFRELGEQSGTAAALLDLGLVSSAQDNLTEARSFFEASLAAFREIGDKRSMAKVLGNLGLVAYCQNDYAAARPLYEQALEIRRELRDKAGIANQLDNLAYVALHQEDFSSAKALFAESLTLLHEIQSKRTIADVLCGLAGVAAAQGAPTRAVRLFGAGQALYDALGARVEVTNRAEYDRGVAAARAGMDDAAFREAWADGQKMTLEQAIAYALEEET